MADELKCHHHEVKADEPCESPHPPTPKAEAVETADRGLFGFGGKKYAEPGKECDQGDAIATEFKQKVQVCDEKGEKEPEEEKKHEGLLHKLHRSGSSSSSSSDEEEVDENGEKKKKKKKGLKEKIKEKVTGEKKEGEEKAEVKCEEDTAVPVERYDDAEDKKGLLEKIKAKLPGSKKTEEVAVAHPPPPPAAEEECAPMPELEGKEKKGLLEMIKEKLPGYHSKE